MGDRQDVSNELSQDSLERASVLLALDPDFDTHVEDALLALWFDYKEYNEKFSPKVTILNKRIDWGMAHELSGTWWFMSSLYRWWYKIDLKDNQRYLLDVLIKLRSGKMQYSRLSAGEKAILRVFSSNSLAPFYMYMKSTFMGREGFQALCQLFALVWSAVRARSSNQPILFNQRQDSMKTVTTLFNMVTQQPLTDEQQALSQRICNLEDMFKGYYKALLKKDKSFIPAFFTGVDSPFCVWQRLYLKLKKEADDLSTCHLSGVVVDGKSGAELLKEVKEKLEHTQQCALELAEEYMQQKSNQMKVEISDALKNAQSLDVTNIKEFESVSDRKIRKFNRHAMQIGADNIPILNDFRKKEIISLQELQARYKLRLEQPERRANDVSDYIDKYSFDSFGRSYKSIQEILLQLNNHHTLQEKMTLIFSLVTQLINAVDEQAKISDPTSSRGKKHLFAWLGFKKQHNAVMGLFLELETAFIETYREAKAVLDPSSSKVSTHNTTDAVLNLPAQMKEQLNFLRTLVSFEGNNADTKLAREFFDKYAKQLDALEADAILYKEHVHITAFFTALNAAEETAHTALISHIGEKSYLVEVMEGIIDAYKTSVQEALGQLPNELRERPDVQSKVNESKSAFKKILHCVDDWLVLYENTLSFFEGDKEDFEKLRKELALQYHPDTAKARQDWSNREREVFSAIFNKFHEWAIRQSLKYKEAEILADGLPKRRGLDWNNLDSLRKFVIAHKTYTRHQLDLWYRKHYAEAVLENEKVKVLRDEIQKLKEQTNSPNNDAIILYEAPPQYPQENSYEIFLRFDQEISILINRLKKQRNPKYKNEEKEELLAFMENEASEMEQFRERIEGIIEKKEFFIQRRMEKCEGYLQGWKKDLAYYEKLENEGTVLWNQLNTFETYLDGLESTLDLVPKKCLYGYDTPRSERFLEGDGLKIRGSFLLARFNAVTEVLPGESGTRLYGWDRVKKKFSNSPDSLYEGTVYCLKSLGHEKGISAQALKVLVTEHLETKFQSSNAKVHQRCTYSWKDEIFAIADILGICIEVENRTKFSTVYGELDAPLINLLQDANSDVYHALIPLEQYVGQFVSYRNTVEENQAPSSPRSSSSSGYVDEETDDRSEQRSSTLFMYQGLQSVSAQENDANSCMKNNI